MLKLIFGILISMLLLIVLMFGQLVDKASDRPDEEGPQFTPKYHIQLLLHDTNEYFWTLFKEGANDAAREFKIYPEFITIAQQDISDLTAAVEMGVNSGVDGIILTAADSEETQKLIDKAEANGVPIVAYENDNYILPNTPVVGTNSYSLGYMAGELALEAADDAVRAALIIPNSGSDGDVKYNNMIVQGLLESFSAYSRASLVSTLTINPEMFEAEMLASIIVDKHKDVNLIICMDESSTPGIAQSLVDNNVVGDIKLIGYGLMPQTVDYIKKGVIHGTIYPDAYEIGYMAVRQLYKLMEGQPVSDSIITDLNAVDLEDILSADLDIPR